MTNRINAVPIEAHPGRMRLGLFQWFTTIYISRWGKWMIAAYPPVYISWHIWRRGPTIVKKELSAAPHHCTMVAFHTTMWCHGLSLNKTSWHGNNAPKSAMCAWVWLLFRTPIISFHNLQQSPTLWNIKPKLRSWGWLPWYFTLECSHLKQENLFPWENRMTHFIKIIFDISIIKL